MEPQGLHQGDNAWGAVIFTRGNDDHAWYFQVCLPTDVLKQFSSSTASIYVLETWVALIAPLTFEPLLGKFYVQCCDNEAARHALIKGVGKHQPLNSPISAHWAWRNRRGVAHRLERVPTKANIADPVRRFADCYGLRSRYLMQSLPPDASRSLETSSWLQR